MVAYLVAPQDLQVVIAVCNESIFPINCLHERNALLVTPLNNSNELVKSLHRQTGQNKWQSSGQLRRRLKSLVCGCGTLCLSNIRSYSYCGNKLLGS